MSTTPEFFPVSEDIYKDADQEFYGHHERLERQLKHPRFVIGSLAVTAAVALATTGYLASQVGKKPVHVIRINDVGRAEALAYFDDSYRPQAPEVRYFRAHWARQRYTRNRQTTLVDYPQNYFFLERTLWLPRNWINAYLPPIGRRVPVHASDYLPAAASRG